MHYPEPFMLILCIMCILIYCVLISYFSSTAISITSSNHLSFWTGSSSKLLVFPSFPASIFTIRFAAFRVLCYLQAQAWKNLSQLPHGTHTGKAWWPRGPKAHSPKPRCRSLLVRFRAKPPQPNSKGGNKGCWECYDVRSFLGILERVLVPLPACGSNLKTGSNDAVIKCPSVLQTLQAITKLREGLVFCTKAPERQGAEPTERNGWVCILQSLPWLESFSASPWNLPLQRAGPVHQVADG